MNPKNPYALETEKELAKSLLGYAVSRGKERGKFFEECALRLSDYSFHIKRARLNSFILGMSAAFFLVGLVFWLASIVRGEM